MNIKDMDKTGVYFIINKIDNKRYIGSAAISFKKRWMTHKNQLNTNSHNNTYLQSAWNKYGEHNFEFSIMYICNPEHCLLLEQTLLNIWWDNCEQCYNICSIAGNMLGYNFSINVKQKLSEMKKGKQHSAQAKEKMSKAKLGILFTEEHKNKISKSKIGTNNPRAKLNWDIVNDIRLKYNDNIIELANKYNVSSSTIWKILENKRWTR